ncbi:hypothetical protein SCALIN_C46_0015 [Candidatus Scalindua japonica]|uniref:Ice-binding protein C-terminal domain-containing protein n=2 Tax=Candidatus Scalindua japonica TaxID=1284222 RepID=A0A286U4N0_9BACT|nr:hypothetical protein SCALIN_C46_0015 [Candidatus Scalindua japonica]
MATPVESVFSDPANGWMQFADDDGIATGHGGQNFDTEYLFYKIDGDNLSIGLQTGFDVETGRNGTGRYYTGDLALSFDGDHSGFGGSGYEYALDFGLQTRDLRKRSQGDPQNIDANVHGTIGTSGIDVAGLYENVEWYNGHMQVNTDDGDGEDEPPFAMNEGDIVANALQYNIGDLGTNSFYRIVTFDTTLVSEASDGSYSVHAHYTMNCGNDSIHGGFAVVNSSNSSEPVPEPATVVLLGIGLIGLGGVYIRRRYIRRLSENV